MPITSTNPTTVPAQAPDSLDRLYVRSFGVSSTNPGQPVNAVAELAQYSSTTGQLADAGLSWHDEDLWTLASRRPDADVAVGAVLDNFAAIRTGSPDNVLALLELVAQAVGALAQLPEA